MKAKTVDLEALKRTVRELDPKVEESSEAFGAALVLLTAAEAELFGVAGLEGATRLPHAMVAKFVRNLKANGVFRPRGKGRGECTLYHGGWDDEKAGVTAFWLDVMVAQGLLQRA